MAILTVWGDVKKMISNLYLITHDNYTERYKIMNEFESYKYDLVFSSCVPNAIMSYVKRNSISIEESLQCCFGVICLANDTNRIDTLSTVDLFRVKNTLSVVKD